MKTALCISGKLEDWESSFDSINENLVKVFRPDIFISTWDTEGYENFCSAYNPKSFCALNFDEEIAKINLDKFLTRPNPSIIPMLINLSKVNEIKNKYSRLRKKDYDLLIRIRPDLKINERIKDHEIRDSLNTKTIRLPFFESSKFYNHDEELKKEFAFSFVYEKLPIPNQINDQIALGPDDYMRKYMSSINKIENAVNYLYNHGYPGYMTQVPETVFTAQLQLNNCKYKQLSGTNAFGNLSTQICKRNRQ